MSKVRNTNQYLSAQIGEYTNTANAISPVRKTIVGIGVLLGILLPAGAMAVTFSGNVQFTQDLAVGGSISKGSGSFVIDHPLDPDNKLLFHSFVESPDVKNIYDGVATLDENGEATIQLPSYFEALNRDARYQLFPHGAPAPDLHVKEKITGNSFVVAGGRPHQKISWQITGIRHDPYIEENPIDVEVEKGPDELVDKGEYIHPEIYGN